MPIYEYECDECGDIFEVIQKLSDPQPESHDCGSKKVHRVMSRSSFVLKGEGWYLTDYARKDKKDGGGAAGEKSESKPKTSDKGSSDSKSSESSKTKTVKSQVKGAA